MSFRPAGFCFVCALGVAAAAVQARGVEEVPPPHFSISIHGTGIAGKTLELDAPPYSKTVVESLGDLTVELTPRQDTDPNGRAVVRLLRNYEGARVLLHTAKVAGSNPGKWQLAYLICNDAVTFLSPAPQNLPGCRP